MATNKSPIDQLDRLLLAIESSFPSEGEREFSQIVRNSASEIGELRAQLDERLSRIVNSASPRKRVRNFEGRSSESQLSRSNLDERMSLLRKLAALRPDLSPRIQSVFGAKDAGSDREIDELTSELIKMGLLKEGNL